MSDVGSRAFRHVRRLTGELTLLDYERFTEVVFDELNGIIGLDLMIQETPDLRSDQVEHFSVSHDGQRLVTYKVTGGGGVEILINGGLSLQWAMWRADGFYLVKSGGMHQGVCSAGLTPVDEALIRLNPAVKIINIHLAAED